jgi:hypothetical protein
MTNQPKNNNQKTPEIKPPESVPLLLLPSGKNVTTITPESPLINGEKRGVEEDRDPSTGQFLPGNQGGPGRPKGEMKMRHLIDEALQELGAKDAHGNPVAIEKALVQKIVKMALAGDRKMIELIWNYRDGKPPQFIDVTSKGQHIGKRRLSDEEIKRVDDLFGPKDWPDEDEVELPTQLKKENGTTNTQPQTNKTTGESNAGKDANAQNSRQGGAYESNS